MITSSPERVEQLTRTGAWGTDTLHGLLAQHAERRPERLAVKDQPNREALTGDAPRSLTWRELDQASDNLALQLQSAGVGEGQSLLVQLPNVVELLVVYYAASKLGAIVSPVPVQYGRHELQSLAAALDAGVVLTMARLRDTELAATAREALPDARILVFGEDLTIDATAGAGRCRRAAEDANRVLSICWTSGTTGTPKGVPRSHNMWLATGRCSAAAGSYVPDDVLLNPFPLVNMAALGGFLFPSALLGCAIVLHHPLDPPLFLQQMQDERISFTIAPPALLNQLAKSPELWGQFDFSALRRVGSGSAPLAPWMIETFSRDYGKEVVNFYGSNEGISLFATPETAPEPEVRASMFPRPAADATLATKVVDPESGQEVTAAGERGELLISGATVFDGYFEHDNRDVFTADGYFRTGDLVEICGDGGNYYRIVGRSKDIINRGGMKISPAELDVVLEQHPDVLEAAVCAFPDERLGEKICACLVMQPEHSPPDLASLQDYLLERGFARFKLPERIELFDRLPRNPLGKVQRFALQEAVSAQPEK
ncbi:MAG: class I adenylate-forming enzyme family protein [Halioglobus sp.]|jgi:cyclohexanecarboxylate-CoA ligase